MSKIGTIGFERLNLDSFPEDHHFRKLQAWIDKNILDGKFFEYCIVNGIPIYFNTSYKKIGVNYSAGADSTILLLILAEIITRFNFDVKIVPLTIARWYDLIDERSDNIFNEAFSYLKNRYPTIIEPIIWGFIPPPFENTPLKNIVLPNEEFEDFFKVLTERQANSDVLYFQYYNDWASKTYGLDAVYNATTINPVIMEPISASPRPFRNSTSESFNYPPWIYKDPRFKHYLAVSPFDRVEKSWTTAQYFNFDVEDLYEMTQSCAVFNGCNDVNECFHCFEREWAYKNKFYYLKEHAYEF